MLGFSEKSVTYCSFHCCRPTMGQKGWSQLNQVVNAEALMGFLAMGDGDGENEGEEDVHEIIFYEAALRAIVAVILY